MDKALGIAGERRETLIREHDKIQLYEDQPIRTAWDEENEEWYFSIVDAVCILTEQPDRRHGAKYWSVLKTRMKKEGSQLTTICGKLIDDGYDGNRCG